MKIILTLAVIVGWLVMMLGNLAGAGRTAATMQMRDGIAEGEAKRRTSLLVLGWAGGLTVLAGAALYFIWRH